MKKFTVSNLLHYCAGGLIVLAFVSMLGGCTKVDNEKPAPEDPLTKVDPETSGKARTALVEWLECEECVNNELGMVLEYRDLLQPMLISVLNHGAAPASRALYQHQLEQRHDDLVEYGSRHPSSKPTLPKDEFVALYLGNLDAQYRIRAAEALGSIGGEKVKRALQQALEASDRDDVKRVVSQALDKVG